MASNNLFLSVKISVISVSIVSLAIALKHFLPLLCDFLVSELPRMWISLQAWLTPPYLYFVINFIIVSIAASSRFQQQKVEESTVESAVTIPVPVKIQTEFQQNFVGVSAVYDEHIELMKMPEPESVNQVAEVPRVMEIEKNKEEQTVDESVDSSLIEMPIRTGSMEIPLEYAFSKEKPPVSARFGHRKIAKGNPEGGKSLRVAKPPKRQDTLESTWKMITEGRSMPLARHLKKSDTWETNSHPNDMVPGEQETQVKKSETFNNRTNTSSTLTRAQGGSGKLKKEPSLSQDDLNRRVEAFINKFNEEMRLQRLESLNRYKETMKGGTLYEA
ncbi:hypothetical protein ACHQM5_017449 [Ranunculus cassubicifolius]